MLPWSIITEMSARDRLHPSLWSTYDLIFRAYPGGWTDAEYRALLKVFESTDVSRRALGQVLEALDGTSYAEHYYDLVHDLPHRRVAPEAVRDARRRLEAAGLAAWLAED